MDRKGQRPARSGSADEIGPFINGPAKVVAERCNIDFLPAISADIGDEEVSEAAIKARPPWIAQPERKNLIGAVGAHEHVVAWDGVVAVGIGRERIAPDIEAQDLAQQAVDVLRNAGRAAAVTEWHIEIAIGTEAEPAGLVVEGLRLVDPDDQRRTGRIGEVRIRRNLILADLGVPAGIDQVDIEEAVAGKIRIKGEAQETALAVGLDLCGDIEEGHRQNLPAGKVENLDQPALFHNEQAARVAGRGADEDGRGQRTRHPRRGNRAHIARWPIRVEPVDQVRCGRTQKLVATVVTDDEVARHWNPLA